MFKIVTQYIIFPYILQYFNTQLYLLLLYWFIVIRFKKAGKWYICFRNMIQSTESCLGHIVLFNLNLKMVAMFKRTTSINWKGFNIILS